MFARYANSSNWYGAFIKSGVATDVGICERVGGAAISCLSGASASPVATDVYKFELRGTALKLYENGVQVVSVTDSSLSATGSPGLGFGNCTDTSTDDINTGNRVDDFTVVDPGGAAPPAAPCFRSMMGLGCNEDWWEWFLSIS
jgi:hypothetical protein